MKNFFLHSKEPNIVATVWQWYKDVFIWNFQLLINDDDHDEQTNTIQTLESDSMEMFFFVAFQN